MPIPFVGRSIVVRHWAIQVVVECPHCDAHQTVMLIGAAVSRCPTCDAPFAVGGFTWDTETQPTPAIAIGSTPPLVGAGKKPF